MHESGWVVAIINTLSANTMLLYHNIIMAIIVVVDFCWFHLKQTIWWGQNYNLCTPTIKVLRPWDRPDKVLQSGFMQLFINAVKKIIPVLYTLPKVLWYPCTKSLTGY